MAANSVAKCVFVVVVATVSPISGSEAVVWCLIRRVDVAAEASLRQRCGALCSRRRWSGGKVMVVQFQ